MQCNVGGTTKLIKSKKYNIKIKKNELMFFISYILFLIFMTLSTSFYYKYFMSGLKLILVVCCLILLIGEFLNQKLDNEGIKGLIICVILFFIVLGASKGATENAVAAMFLYMYAARNISFEKIAKVSFYILSILLGFIIISSYFGIIDNVLFVKNGRSRWCLGFRYALFAPSIYFNIVCLWSYINKDRKKLQIFLKGCILLLLNYWLYYTTKSRATFAMTCIVILLPFITGDKESNKENAWKKWKFFVPCYFGCFFLSLFLTIFYSNSISWLKNLNDFLGKRLSLGQTSILQNGIGLVGKNITMIGNGMDAYGKISSEAFINYTYVDSLYIQMLIRYGIIFTVIYLVIMTIALYKSYKLKNKIAILIFVLIGLHCMIDDMQLYLQYNTFWLLVGHLLMNKTEKISSTS